MGIPPAPANLKKPSGPLVTAGPPVNPFPPKSTIALVKNDKLQNAVAQAVKEDVDTRKGPPPKFAITIVDPDNSFGMGGFNGPLEYYTGSLVKVGVLYAAFALLDMMRRYVALRSPKSVADLFNGLKADMDSGIAQSCKLIFGGAKPDQRSPNYKDVFSVSNLSGKLLIDFQRSYREKMKRMIINSDNDAAGACIHGLGFGYLNGALEQGGFFDSDTKKGVWAAGDFKHGWTPVRIPCENLSIGTAQGGTTEALARLMAVVVLGNVLDKPSHDEMNKMLMDAAHGSDESFLVRDNLVKGTQDVRLQVTHAKIGLGEDPDVYSELDIVKGVGKKADKTYIVAWQNIDWSFYWTWDIAKIIKRAIDLYEP